MRRQPQRGLRRFIATMASISSFLGPLGPGRRRRPGENKALYFRARSAVWRRSRVEGFRRSWIGDVAPTEGANENRSTSMIADLSEYFGGTNETTSRFPWVRNRARVPMLIRARPVPL